MIGVLSSWTPANVFLRLRWRREGIAAPMPLLLACALALFYWSVWLAYRERELAKPILECVTKHETSPPSGLWYYVNLLTPHDIFAFNCQMTAAVLLLILLAASCMLGCRGLVGFLRRGMPDDWRIIPAKPGEILIAEADYPVILACGAILLTALGTLIPQKGFTVEFFGRGPRLSLEWSTVIQVLMPVAMTWILTIYRIAFMRLLGRWHIESKASTWFLAVMPPCQLAMLYTISIFERTGAEIDPALTFVGLWGMCLVQFYLVLRAPLMLTADSFRE